MLEKQVSFNDGIAHIYTVENAALPGDAPADKLADRRTARFSNRTAGAVQFKSCGDILDPHFDPHICSFS